MNKLVTIGIPIYKRLYYLPAILKVVASQDYPNIELIVSDNGMNGTAVQDLVRRHYLKPFKFRQNSSSVGPTAHFNQLLHTASGHYFVLLADDDEISANYVSDLVAVLEKYPQASMAMSIQESMDEAGNSIRRSKDTVPELLAGPEFIRVAWGTCEYGYRSFSTFLGRTKRMIDCGGFPNIRTGSGDEDALIVKMCLDNYVAFSTRCTFRKRYFEESDSGSLEIRALAGGITDFIRFFDKDPQILQYAAAHPVEWAESRAHLVRMAWRTYYFRWNYMYRTRLPSKEWLLAAFALPFIPAYYKAVASTFMAALLARFEQYSPRAYQILRAAKGSLWKTVRS